jgi:secreted Zn-dependent insulinase-like peptidase
MVVIFSIAHHYFTQTSSCQVCLLDSLLARMHLTTVPNLRHILGLGYIVDDKSHSAEQFLSLQIMLQV